MWFLFSVVQYSVCQIERVEVRPDPCICGATSFDMCTGLAWCLQWDHQQRFDIDEAPHDGKSPMTFASPVLFQPYFENIFLGDFAKSLGKAAEFDFWTMCCTSCQISMFFGW